MAFINNIYKKQIGKQLCTLFTWSPLPPSKEGCDTMPFCNVGCPYTCIMPIGQGQKISSLCDHCHTVIDITPTLYLLMQWGRCCHRIGIPETRCLLQSQTRSDIRFHPSLKDWEEMQVFCLTEIRWAGRQKLALHKFIKNKLKINYVKDVN